LHLLGGIVVLHEWGVHYLRVFAFTKYHKRELQQGYGALFGTVGHMAAIGTISKKVQFNIGYNTTRVVVA